MDEAKHSISAPLSGMNWSGLTWLSGFIVEWLKPDDECLVWVTQWGVWPSSENFHLFYRLRETYGERRRLHEAPGSLFLDYEAADLATFIELGLLFGWDFYVVPTPKYASAFVSHDEFLELRTDDEAKAQRAREVLLSSEPAHEDRHKA
jgi:hypothetical protein